jgi:hypothetical protein
MRTAQTIKRVQKTILPNLGVTLSASSTTYAVWLMTKVIKKEELRRLRIKQFFEGLVHISYPILALTCFSDFKRS